MKTGPWVIKKIVPFLCIKHIYKSTFHGRGNCLNVTYNSPNNPCEVRTLLTTLGRKTLVLRYSEWWAQVHPTTNEGAETGSPKVPRFSKKKILIKNPSRRLGSLRAAGILCSQSRQQNRELVVLPTSHQEALWCLKSSRALYLRLNTYVIGVHGSSYENTRW